MPIIVNRREKILVLILGSYTVSGRNPGPTPTPYPPSPTPLSLYSFDCNDPNLGVVIFGLWYFLSIIIYVYISTSLSSLSIHTEKGQGFNYQDRYTVTTSFRHGVDYYCLLSRS